MTSNESCGSSTGNVKALYLQPLKKKKKQKQKQKKQNKTTTTKA